MKGIVYLHAAVGDISVDLVLRRNVTILRGDSGTFKTGLFEIVNGVANEVAGYTCEASVPGCSFHAPTLYSFDLNKIKKNPDSIVVIDEATVKKLNNKFAEAIKTSSAYWIIISRADALMSDIPCSVKEVYELKIIDNKIVQLPFYHIPDSNVILPKGASSFYAEGFITEDSGSGHKFFSKVFPNAKVAVGAGSNTKVANKLRKNGATGDNILVTVDGANYGTCMYGLLTALVSNRVDSSKVAIYFMESFEWFVLHSLVFKDDEQLQSILSNPHDYVDSLKHLTHERFYTSLFESKCKELDFKYEKKEVPDCIYDKDNMDHLLSLIHGVEFPSSKKLIDINKDLTAEDFANIEAFHAKLREMHS